MLLSEVIRTCSVCENHCCDTYKKTFLTLLHVSSFSNTNTLTLRLPCSLNVLEKNENICFSAYLRKCLTKMSPRCSGQRDVKQKPKFVDSEQSTQTLAWLSMNSTISLLFYMEGKKVVFFPFLFEKHNHFLVWASVC